MKGLLNKIKLYLRDIIINLQKCGTWKVQFTITINFISSKDVDDECVMHSESGSIEFMTYDNAIDIVDELFESLFRDNKLV